jgi:hypothetical protein
MIIHVVKAIVIPPYELDITFDNGQRRRIDLSKELYGPIFEPLRDPEFFARVFVDPDSRTVTWPNGADFAPDFLFETAGIEVETLPAS